MTYSLVARDHKTGKFGVATATGLLAVGALVPHVMGGVGAVATQGYSTNPFYGPDGLALLHQGLSAKDTVHRLTQGDEGRDSRQLIVLDRAGDTAGWTGAGNIDEKRHICRSSCAVAGNMLANAGIVEVMADTYLKNEDAPFCERLLGALKAGADMGGDLRRQQSAALLIAGDEGYATIDLRVDDHADPVKELMRLSRLAQEPRFTAFMNRIPTRSAPHRS